MRDTSHFLAAVHEPSAVASAPETGGEQSAAQTVPPHSLSAWALDGMPEIKAGDDLPELIAEALTQAFGGAPGEALPLKDGDIVVVTSKIVSKAEGRAVPAASREDAITRETVRTVASRASARGTIRIVENRLGIVGAAAGVDASNVPAGHVLLLPLDPDRTAAQLREALSQRFAVRLGVIITDTLGRAWRNGQTDVAIGASGVRVLEDLRGSCDADGQALEVSLPAVGDEIAGLCDLVKGKASRRPVAVVRGLGHLVTGPDCAGAGALVRSSAEDMFRMGTDEALEEGYRRGYADAMRTIAEERSCARQ
jgi:coenzyme F420-0:L-glutamate ligase/coenzyme F420-1:gamma-L-glutamate ligase